MVKRLSNRDCQLTGLPWLLVKHKLGMTRDRMVAQKLDSHDGVWLLSNRTESTTSDMFSWLGLHLDSRECALYMMAHSDAETVDMYIVLCFWVTILPLIIPTLNY